MKSWFERMADALKQPSQNMTWIQLAATVVFVTVVAVMWRQVVLMIVKET